MKRSNQRQVRCVGQIELVRENLAKYIIEQARNGESRLVRSLVGFQSRRLRLSARRRLCNTVGARFIDGSARRCCAISAARSRAAARTNLARSNQSLFLRSRFGGAKRPALVNIFMICPRLVGSCLADDKQILPRDGGLLMAINPSNHAAGDPRSQKRVPIEEAKEAPRVARPPIPGVGGLHRTQFQKENRKNPTEKNSAAAAG
jgi:hypothetical protein